MIISKRKWFGFLVFMAVIWIGSEAHAASPELSIEQRIAALEEATGGRIGIALLNAGGDKLTAYRGEERFPFCSTFKAVLAGAVLKRSETNSGFLDKTVTYEKSDLVWWSPITEKNLTNGMTVSDLCAAAVQHSDNGAANILMRELGGPEAVTAFSRSIGDSVFSLNRWETELNSAEPGDLRDTTSPLAMAETLRKLTLGDALKPEQQKQLQDWLKGNTTGDAAIRAGIPKDWIVGDKTGNGSYGTTNDIAVIWPLSGSPFVLTAYFTQPQKDASSRKEILAQIASMAAEEIRAGKKN